VLFLQFEMGPDRYVLAASAVREVLPLVDVRPVPHAPAGVAGVVNCRGSLVPVIDLSLLVLGQPARRCLSTRMILVDYPDGRGGRQPLALIAERATRTIERKPEAFAHCGITNPLTPYLGAAASDDQGLVQQIEVEHLLPASMRGALLGTAGGL
jgi:chemotaxis-related protein WspB